MKKIEGYTKEIEINGEKYTITMIKRLFKKTRVFYDSYLTSEDTGNSILLDNMEQNHPTLGKLSINKIMDMAEEQAYDLCSDLERIDIFTRMFDWQAEEIYERTHAHAENI